MPLQKIKIITDACCKIPDAHILGRSKKGHSACGVVLLDQNDQTLNEVGKYLGEVTAPQAEYMGLIFALDKAGEICRGEVEVWMDSEFVVRQLNGDYGIKSENMKPLYHEVKTLEQRFLKGVKYFHHPRTSVLAKRANQIAEIEYRKCRS
jgi:ribonuclease HI